MRRDVTNREGGIPETVSLNRPKRGRPPLLGPDESSSWLRQGFFDRTKTRRGRNDAFYHRRAFELIGCGSDPEFYWLVDGPAVMEGTRTKTFRHSILIELGRIASDEDLLAVARRICELEPKSREAVAMIRRFRLGGSKPGDADDLAEEIRSTINDYHRRHPDTGWSIVLQSLANVRSDVEDQLQGPSK